MKSTIYPRLFAIAVAGILAACSAAAPDDKKAELEKLKTQQADIAEQILKLETEIASANPDSTANVKTKEVAVTEIALQKFDHYVQTQGSVEAEENILVSAKSMGAVTAVYVTEGQQVSRGQVLAQLDDAVIRQNIDGVKAQLELANTIYNRQKNLWDQKIGTEVQFLQAKTNKESLEKQLASIKEQGDMSKIISPINGTVDEVTAKVGENLAPGMPAVRVVNSSNLKLKANVSEAYVTDIRKGNKVVIDIPELKKELIGQVSFVGKTIDPLSRTFAVEIKLPSLADLRPNMTGVVKVVYRTENSTLVVPVNIIQDINNEKVVYIAEKKGNQTVASRKVVIVEGVFDNQAQVKGLNAGDKIITVGYQGLNDGDFVKI